MLFCAQPLLLLRPHKGGIGFIIPHRVTEIRIQKHVRLMHVADHALAGRNHAREPVPEWVPGFSFRNRWVYRYRNAVVTVLRISTRMPGVTIVGIYHMAGGASRRTVVAGLVVGAEKPHQRIVQAGLLEIDQRHGNSRTGPPPTIRLADVGPARFLQPLYLAADVRQADLWKQVADISAAAFKNPEHIAWFDCFPRGQGAQFRQYTMGFGNFGGKTRTSNRRRFSVRRIGLPQYVFLERQDSIVIRGASPEHRSGSHQRAYIGIDQRLMAGATGLAGHSVV
ncbi:hypothetical protein MnTg04_01194 [bacterium MnTg04]|nr:hypothetical protein MnTg04_01194 [bacterium MnTg04]